MHPALLRHDEADDPGDRIAAEIAAMWPAQPRAAAPAPVTITATGAPLLTRGQLQPLVLAAMQPGQVYTIGDLAAVFCRQRTSIESALSALYTRGLVSRERRHDGNGTWNYWIPL